MAEKDNNWSITIDHFENGYSPLAFTDSLTETGSSGHASVMQNVDILNGKLTQGAGLANLTNGTQSGVVDELVQFIMDRATADDVSWAFGLTKLFKISSTTVESGSSITGATEGESLLALRGNLYGFYNKSTGGDIFKMPLSTEVIDADWGTTETHGNTTALEDAPHPSAGKEDIFLFGNGQYVGTYIEETNTLTPQKLDFGAEAEIADIVFSRGYWWIAVNNGASGTNRTASQLYLYDGAAQVSTLSDETAIGVQRIGFLHIINGILYIAYEDLTSTGFIIGFVQGKAIVPLVRYNGTLPTFNKKTLFKNTILFLSDNLLYSAGALVPELPFQLSQIATSTYSTSGAVAAPFGTVFVSSTDGGSNFSLAKFSGFTKSTSWKSIVFPVSLGRFRSMVDSITVLTKTLGAGASCALTLETDQASDTSNILTVTTTGKRRHVFNGVGLGQIEDFRVVLDSSSGSTTNDCLIRSIKIDGHFVEN